MKGYQTFLYSLLILVPFIFPISSCSKDDTPNDSGSSILVGTWTSRLILDDWGDEDDLAAHHYFHFKKDGTYFKIYVYHNGDYHIDNGKWKLSDEGKGEYELWITSHPFGDERFDWEFYAVSFPSEDSMILEQKYVLAGGTTTYSKVPDSAISQYQ